MLRRKSLLAGILLLSLLFSLLPWQREGTTLRDTVLSVSLIPKAEAATPGIPSFLEGAAQKFISGVLQIFVVLNWIALSGVQALLDPDVIFGNPMQLIIPIPVPGLPIPIFVPITGPRPMEALLHGLWVLSRNIVNAIFAFILLAGGIYLILGAGGEGTSKIKQAAPKFVLAVILVNFSWFFPRVIFDAANVLTSVVYQIPFLTGPTLPCLRENPDGVVGNADDVPCDFVWRVVFFPLDSCKPTPPAIACPRPTKNGIFPLRGQQIGGNFVDIYYTSWSDVVSNGSYTVPGAPPVPVSGASAILNGLAVNFAKIPNLAIIDFQHAGGPPGTLTALEQAGAYLKFFVELVLHSILSIAVGLALLALLVVLIVRMGVLWLCIAFMPFIFVGFAMGKPLGELGKEGAPNIWQKFLSYAFLPVLVAIPFAVGFTLVSRLYSSAPSLPININIEGLDFLKEIDNFHHLLWMIIAIAIIWFGVFAVLEKDSFAGGIVKAIKGIGSTGLKIAGYGAAYGLQVPLPGGGAASLGGLAYKLKRLPEDIRLRGIQAMEGGGRAAPATEQVKIAVTGMNPQQVEELKGALRDARSGAVAGSASTALDELARKLGNILPGISPTQAQGIVSNRESLKNLIDESVRRGAVTRGEGEDFMSKFDEHFRTRGAAGGGRINVQLTSGMSKDAAQKHVAEQVSNTLATTAKDVGEIEREIEEAFQKATTQNQKDGIRAVLEAINEGQLQGTSDVEKRAAVRAKVDALKNSPPPPATP